MQSNMSMLIIAYMYTYSTMQHQHEHAARITQWPSVSPQFLASWPTPSLCSRAKWTHSTMEGLVSSCWQAYPPGRVWRNICSRIRAAEWRSSLWKKKTETVVSLPHDSENKQRCNLGLLTTRQYGRGTYNSFTESYKCVVIKGRNTTMVSFKRDRNVFSETRIFLRACNSLDYYWGNASRYHIPVSRLFLCLSL